jgi:hypothetical protein
VLCCGGVLTGTLSAELTSALAGAGHTPDPDTGLVHLGDGRWYDLALGRPLQPNPFGGVPTVPQSLNRFAATPLGQPGVREGVASTWNPFSGAFVSNTVNQVLSTSLYDAAEQGLGAYLRASLHTIPGNPIWAERTILVASNSLVEEGLLRAGTAGLVLKKLVGAPPGSSRARFFGAGRTMFEQAMLRNSDEVAVRAIVGYEISYAHRLPAGRVVGKLVAGKLGLHALDLGIGVIVDVGYQAWLDHNNPYLTRSQFAGRLVTAGIGSGVSFVAGLAAPALLGGPVTWVALGTGIVVAILWDIAATPVIYRIAGLNPERNLAPLQE